MGGPGPEITLWDAASWQLRASLRGHHAIVNFLASSADSRSLVSAGTDGRLGTWDLAAARLIRFLLAGPRSLCGLAGTPDGEIISVCHFSQGVFRCRLDGTSGDGVTILDESGPYVTLALSADGPLLAASTAEGTIDLWDLPTQRRIAILDGHTGPVSGMAFTPDGRTLVSGGSDGIIRAWLPRDDGGDGPRQLLPTDTQQAAAATSSPKS